MCLLVTTSGEKIWGCYLNFDFFWAHLGGIIITNTFKDCPFSGVIDFRRIEHLTEITNLKQNSDTSSIFFTFDHFIDVKVSVANDHFYFKRWKWPNKTGRLNSFTVWHELMCFSYQINAKKLLRIVNFRSETTFTGRLGFCGADI